MDNRHPALGNSSPLERFLDRFVKHLVLERIDNGYIDVQNMNFADMEMLSLQFGRRVAQHLGHEMTGRQSEMYSDDYCCPTCGLECEALRYTRTIHSNVGESEVVGLKSYCLKCRRSFFPVRNVTGLDGRTFSPHARDRILLAAAETHSYARAEHVLTVLTEIEISSRQINRLAD